MKTTRSYTMGARAEAVQRTRLAILDATDTLHRRHRTSDIGLDDVAGAAGVSVQTVLRHFGSREGLFEAAAARAEQVVNDERRTPVGDVPAAVRVLVEHYEARGDEVLLLLAQEDAEAFAREFTTRGKALHRAWVVEVFAPYLTDDDGELVDLLVVATDVYAWKLLRRDRGLSRSTTEQRIRRLVEALLPHHS